MNSLYRWRKEPGARIEGSRPLDAFKVQAPCCVRLPFGGYRLFYTAVGPGKPFPECQGYILSAVSADLLQWDIEPGIRLQGFDGVGGPRYLPLPGGGGRLYGFASEFGPGGLKSGARLSQSIISAMTTDGLHFEFEPGYRLRDRTADYNSIGITAAEAIPPAEPGGEWTMFFSPWQDLPPGKAAPRHPSQDPDAVAKGSSADFAAASIAADMAGYRSRIYIARSRDGLRWEPVGCAIEGAGYGGEGLDAVHAEDMSLVQLDDGRYRMYYAACDKAGHWRIASAISDKRVRQAGRPDWPG
jgi:hypothetical protein